MQFSLNMFVNILLIAAAINWGLVAYNGTDIVDKLTPGNPNIERGVKLVIGAAGLYAAYTLVNKKMSPPAYA
jgi:uncharacterized membrane protein YuzA (DUF378 family)